MVTASLRALLSNLARTSAPSAANGSAMTVRSLAAVAPTMRSAPAMSRSKSAALTPSGACTHTCTCAPSPGSCFTSYCRRGLAPSGWPATTGGSTSCTSGRFGAGDAPEVAPPPGVPAPAAVPAPVPMPMPASWSSSPCDMPAAPVPDAAEEAAAESAADGEPGASALGAVSRRICRPLRLSAMPCSCSSHRKASSTRTGRNCAASAPSRARARVSG
mmetsp:Transcript_31171/g.78755  ORF Transcript_31171/g.78755 Transcript_31171/m.78755 type:complete len:217 (+) Transcript_31171:283-933(+)